MPEQEQIGVSDCGDELEMALEKLRADLVQLDQEKAKIEIERTEKQLALNRLLSLKVDRNKLEALTRLYKTKCRRVMASILN